MTTTFLLCGVANLILPNPAMPVSVNVVSLLFWLTEEHFVTRIRSAQTQSNTR